MKIVLFVEGHTEKKALPELLKLWLDSRKLPKGYTKVIDGANLFAELKPEVAYGKCPALQRLMDDMLQLAGGSGT